MAISVGDLIRYLVIGTIVLVLATFGLKVWNKQKLEKQIIKELRDLEEQRALDPESDDESIDEDPYVRETGEILVDYMNLIRENQVARQG